MSIVFKVFKDMLYLEINANAHAVEVITRKKLYKIRKLNDLYFHFLQFNFKIQLFELINISDFISQFYQRSRRS